MDGTAECRIKESDIMKYKYIPKPTLQEEQEARPLHAIDNDIFITGWEVGHYEEVVDETLPEELPEGVEPQKEWVKDYEAMELTPEQEAEWEWEQEHPKPTKLDEIEAQALYTALMTDTLIEEE